MLRVLGILFGLLLLAPGLCSLGLIGTFGFEYLRAPGSFRAEDWGFVIPMAVLWAVCFAISAAGIAMLRRSLSRAPIETPEGRGDLYATRPRLIVRILGWSILAFLAAGFVVGLLQGILR